MADNEEKFSVDKEQLKNETKETVNQVKDSIKNVNLKKDTEETKGFLKEMFSNPFETIKKVAEEQENIFSKVVILMIFWLAASVISGVIMLIKYGTYTNIGNKVLEFISYILHPLLYVLVPAVIILIMNRKNKKSLITIISTLTISAVPVILDLVVNIISLLVNGISIITNPISTMLSALALVFSYFGMKYIFGEDDDKNFIKKYAIIKLIAAFIFIVLGRTGIY